jgi:Acetyltransferase (GNAT) domain
MRVDHIDTLEDFRALEHDWNRVHRLDPEAEYFVSWRWLEVVLAAHPGQWLVLGALSESCTKGLLSGLDNGYCAFLPLRLRDRWSHSRNAFGTEFDAAGRLSWAQYTGFVCDPALQERAIAALAQELRGMPWSYLRLTNWLASDRRFEAFLRDFPPEEYELSFDKYEMDGGRIDNLVCPFVELPGSFEEYLATRPSANTRQKMRRFLRKADGGADGLGITRTRPEQFEAHLELLLGLWMRQWAPVRGQASARKVADKYREILAQSAALGAVMMPVLWQGERALGGLVHIADHNKKSMHFIMAARDLGAEGQFIGLVLHAYAIRWAIENGIAVYDLCHGDEPYKYSLGAKERRIDNLVVRRRSARLAQVGARMGEPEVR